GPHIRKIYPDSIGFTDATLLPYQKISLSPTGASKISASCGTTIASLTTISCLTATKTPKPAPIATTACDSKQILCRKILLINIVSKADQGNTAIIFEKTDIASGGIAIIGAITGIHSTKLTVAHIGLGDNVHRLLS